MVLSLMFIVGFFSLFLLPITFITILFSQERQSHHHGVTTIDDKPHTGSIWRLLFGHVIPMSGKSKSKNEGEEKLFAGRREAGEECRVCLCEVEEGEEITDLRCNHLFHKVCLDAWIGSGHATCPLCRGRVFGTAAGSSELLFFQFTSMANSRRANREGNWWIR